MNALYEGAQISIGLAPVAINNNNATGPYYSMKNFRRALFILGGGAMAATKTSILALYQATNAAAGSAKAITDASATITANEDVTELTITLASVLADETIVVNGLTFTAHATVTTVADREFSISGDDTADAAALVTCINDSVYGCPGVTATSALGVVTLVSTDPGAVAITAASEDATFVVATTKAVAYVEVDHMALDHALGFTHVAAKVTTTANTVVSVTLLRGDPREGITQVVGASAAV